MKVFVLLACPPSWDHMDLIGVFTTEGAARAAIAKIRTRPMTDYGEDWADGHFSVEPVDLDAEVTPWWWE